MTTRSEDSKLRFSSRVGAYVKYRPGYPAGVMELYREAMGLVSTSKIADVGSGTGISAEPLLRNGNTVFCVEPNADMRGAAETSLSGYAGFRSVNGTGEATTLPDASIDLVISAQAFHWFDHPKAAAEFKRICKPGGHVAILWNDRKTDTSPFLAAYDALLTRYGTDYSRVAHEKSPMSVEYFSNLFGVAFERAAFANEQWFDLEGLRGRVASSSYTPAEGQPGYVELYVGIDDLFSQYAERERVVFEYETEVYFARTLNRQDQTTDAGTRPG